MKPSLSSIAVLLSLATTTACIGPLPPPPELTVSSPQRGLVQSETGKVTVTGFARPGPSGSPISKVTVNNVTAMLAGDGSFTAVVDVPAGAMLLKTIAVSEEGAAATDARAVHVGQLRPVGSVVERAITTTLSTETFAKLSAAAGPILKSMDLMSMLAPMQPMANVGDEFANAKLSITRLSLGNPSISLTPVDGGLMFSAQLGALDVGANVSYGGVLVPDGSTSVGVTADQVTISGTLVLTPAGTGGFTAKLAAPTVRTTNLRLRASGLIGQILDLVDGVLGSTIERLATTTAEGALGPMLNEAFGALMGPKYIDVHGKKIELLASPSAIAFSSAGALVTMNIGAKIMGSDSSPGYIFTPNGMPALDVSRGVQLALADDLLNQMFAQVHALGLLDYRLQEDFGLFDAADFKATLPPMISANTGDGKLRLVLGDMIATFSDNGKTVISAALNASVDVEVRRGTAADQISLEFGKLDVFVNAIDGGDEYEELFAAASTGIGVQLESLGDFLVTVPVPSVAGLTLDNLALRGDSGYAIVSGQIH